MSLYNALKCDSLLANFVFRNCSLNYISGETPYGIITIANCSTSQKLGTIAFHHLEFEANYLNRSAALEVHEPSCSSIQIINTMFQNNSCIGVCAASLVGRTEIRNIALTGNRFFEEDVRGPMLIGVHSGSNTTNIYGLTASGNNGTVVQVQYANMSISNSHIFQNSGVMTVNGYYTGGVTFMDSFGQILDCHFVENTGHTGSSISVENSTIVVERTSVVGCNATDRGGGISIKLSSTVRILDSFIANNSVAVYGGGVYSSDTTDLQIENTTFEMNSAERGGGIYLNELIRASLLSNHFVRNRVSSSGGGALLRNGTYMLESSAFEDNASNKLGGGFSCFHSSLNVSNTSFSRNNASTSGGGSNVYGNSSTWFANCTWEANFARSSGGGAYFEDGPIATITASGFIFNQAEFGGGAYATNANITLIDDTGDHNSVTRSGAVLFFMQSNGTVSKCRFARNIADWGGVFYLHETAALISISSFVSNKASVNGGAIRCGDLSVLTIEDSSFASNSANGNGGAIYVFGSVVSATKLRFQDNRASSLGGAVSLQRGASSVFSHSVFFNESGVQWGGALSATDSELSLRNISIASCSAVSGGGVYLYESLANVSELSVTFCEASESGGGIRMVESHLRGRVLNISLNKAVGTSRYGPEGGGIAMRYSSTLSIRNFYIDGNRAQYCGGIYARSECSVFVSNARFYNNSARTSGGAVFHRATSLTFQRVSCVRNSAFYGGSVYAYNSSLTLNDSQLINSSSTDDGGSVFAREGVTVVIEETRIQSSSAEHGGGIMLIDSYFWGYRVSLLNCSARAHGGGVGLNESSSLLCTDCLFDGNSASQEGGAVRLESANPQQLAFQIENTVFQGNDAAFGGAIHFRTGGGSTNCSDVNFTKCTFLALTGCVFRNNLARSAGGAILANNPSAIRISCQLFRKTYPFEYYTREELGAMSELSSLDGVCENWTNNTASTYGPIVGSYARRVSTLIVFDQNQAAEMQGNRHVLHNHQSGVPLPTLSLKAVDEYSQGPALIQDNHLIEAVMTSPDGLFAGVFIVRMEGSQGNFSGITAFKEPGSYDIRINFSERVMPTLTIVVEIRKCLIGEAAAGNGTICEPCGDSNYNFHPLSNQECTPCPEDAMCDSVAIRPKKGFWHQTPCSNHVQRCLSERACNEESRETKLLELGSLIENCDFDDEFIGKYSEALCREGYTGPLCGSCIPSHGKTRSFRCRECYGIFVNLFLVSLSALILLGLAGFTIRSGLPARRRSPSVTPPRREESPSSPLVNIQMVEMWYRNHPSRNHIPSS